MLSKFYEHVVEEQLEGIVAKRLSSRYLSGRRTGAWIKIKPTRLIDQISPRSTIVRYTRAR